MGPFICHLSVSYWNETFSNRSLLDLYCEFEKEIAQMGGKVVNFNKKTND